MAAAAHTAEQSSAEMPPFFAPVVDAPPKINGARKVLIHDAAHLPNLEHPEQFNRLLLDFLNALPSPRRQGQGGGLKQGGPV